MKCLLTAFVLMISTSLIFGALPKEEKTEVSLQDLPADVLWTMVLLQKNPIIQANLLGKMSRINKDFAKMLESKVYTKQKEGIITRGRTLANFFRDNRTQIKIYKVNPAFQAIKNKNLEVLKLLLDPKLSGNLSIDKNMVNTSTGHSLLSYAIDVNAKGIFNFLVKQKDIDVNAGIGDKKPIVIAAIAWGDGDESYVNELRKNNNLIIDEQTLEHLQEITYTDGNYQQFLDVVKKKKKN